MGKPEIPLTPGTKFGKWSILHRDKPNPNNCSIYYRVVCDCGFESSVAKYDLTKGKSNSCPSCRPGRIKGQ